MICSLDRWQYGGGEKEEIFSNPLFFVYQTDHQKDRKKLILICRHKQLQNSPVYILLFIELTVKHRRTGTLGGRGRGRGGAAAVTFLPEKTQYPNRWFLKSGCKRRRSLFSQLMKLLSLEKIAQLRVTYILESWILNGIERKKCPSSCLHC